MRTPARPPLTAAARSLVGSLATAFVLWAPSALACPVCGTSKEESRVAFILMTAFMTLMPLLLLGGAGYMALRRYRAADRAREAEAAAAGDDASFAS